jgi:hypothetical protein
MNPNRFRRCDTWLVMFALTTAHMTAWGQDIPTSASAPRSPTATNSFLAHGAEDVGWPSIRGSKYDGVSGEIHLADDWPDQGPPVLWVKELGPGYSSFVVKHDRAYTQYQTLAGQYVICLDASTGQTVWSYRYDWPFQASGLYPGPQSTPTLAHERIYFATPAGAVGCLNQNGKLVWLEDLKTKFNGKGTDFGYACSPTVVDEKVIMPVGGVGASVVALDAYDGSVVWKSGDASASYTPALPITVNGHRQIVAYLEHDLAAFDLETGQLLWQKHLSNGYDEHAAWPIFRDPYLWTSAPFQAGSQLLKLGGGPEASFSHVWQSPVLSNDVSSSVLVDGYLYGFDLAEAQSKAHRPSRGSFRCVEFMTGDVRWSNGDAKVRRSTDAAENKASHIIGHASVIVADGKLILFNDLGDLILAKVDSEKYIELARTTALGGEIGWTSPALDRGRVFLRNHSRAVCIYLGEPELLPSITTSNLLTVSDIPRGVVRDLSSFLGIEPEYAMDPPTHRWLRVWFAVSLGILGVAAFVTGAIKLCARSLPASRVRICFWSIALGLGLVTGVPASLASGSFVFTWQVSLLIAFQIAVYQSAIRRKVAPSTPAGKWQDRAVAITFVTICIGYFLLCRRLSLVTEWIFLCGFAAACPFLLLGRVLSYREKPVVRFAELALTVVAYAAFFWSSAVLLSLKYDLSPF